PPHVDDLGLDVLRPVTEGVDDDAAGHGAVWAGAPGLGGARDLELAHLRVGAREIEAEGHAAPDRGGLEESAPPHAASGVAGSLVPPATAVKGYLMHFLHVVLVEVVAGRLDPHAVLVLGLLVDAGLGDHE